MSDLSDSVKQSLIKAIEPIIQQWQGEIPYRELVKLGHQAVKEYFYFGADNKLCSKCLAVKHVDEYGIDQSKPDGLYMWCKECRAKHYKERKNAVVSGM